MKRNHWLVLDFHCPDSIPSEGQEIFFSISEGEGRPFSPTGRMSANLDAFRRLMTINPDWLIIWQPAPSIPPPPADYRIICVMGRRYVVAAQEGVGDA